MTHDSVASDMHLQPTLYGGWANSSVLSEAWSEEFVLNNPIAYDTHTYIYNIMIIYIYI